MRKFIAKHSQLITKTKMERIRAASHFNKKWSRVRSSSMIEILRLQQSKQQLFKMIKKTQFLITNLARNMKKVKLRYNIPHMVLKHWSGCSRDSHYHKKIVQLWKRLYKKEAVPTVFENRFRVLNTLTKKNFATIATNMSKEVPLNS